MNEDNKGMTPEAEMLVNSIKWDLKVNNGKLSENLVEGALQESEKRYDYHRGVTTCIVTLPTGHKVVGYAMIMKECNSDNILGAKVALADAKKKLWNLLAIIAKLFMKECK